MRIDLVLAATLAAIVDEGTLDAAARKLHITPSAVSQRLKSLEQQLGRVLLIRSKPAATTDAGRAVVALARQHALLEHDALAALDLEGAEERTATIALAVNADSLATWFLAPLARLTQRHPMVFDVHRDDQEFTAALLESGTVLGAVTAQSSPVAGCRVTSLGVLRYEAVATPAFAERWLGEGADAGALAAAPLVDFDRRDDLQTRWLAGMGVAREAPPRHYVPASADFARAVRAGLGWGMLPHLQSAEGLAAGRLIRLEGPTVDVALYWQQWNLRSRLLDEIAAEIAAEAARVLRPPERGTG